MSKEDKKKPVSKTDKRSRENFSKQESREQNKYIGESEKQQGDLRKGSEIPPRPKKEK
tara:strand:+ start:1876 stop:2049 length:174 start_codon:yes stop_codon:yes gene_type:complete